MAGPIYHRCTCKRYRNVVSISLLLEQRDQYSDVLEYTYKSKQSEAGVKEKCVVFRQATQEDTNTK